MGVEEQLVADFIKAFPEFQINLDEHIDFNEEILPHVFFGDELNPVLLKLLLDNNDHRRIQSFFDFFERRMTASNDAYAVNVLTTTILARLGDDPKTLKNAFPFMGPGVLQLAIEIERFLERH
jgi:hypothetical protein